MTKKIYIDLLKTCQWYTYDVYIDKNQNIRTTVYCKEADFQSYLQGKTTFTAFKNESAKLIQKFMGRGYKADEIKAS